MFETGKYCSRKSFQSNASPEWNLPWRIISHALCVSTFRESFSLKCLRTSSTHLCAASFGGPGTKGTVYTGSSLFSINLCKISANSAPCRMNMPNFLLNFDCRLLKSSDLIYPTPSKSLFPNNSFSRKIAFRRSSYTSSSYL